MIAAPAPSVYARALHRVQQEFTRTTDALIHALFLQSREQSPLVEARIRELETRRDELHARLEELEVREAGGRASAPAGTLPLRASSGDTAPSAAAPPGAPAGDAR